MSHTQPSTPDGVRRIVVGVDGSAESVLALQYAQRLAPAFHAKIVAIDVWSYPISYTPLPTMWSPEEDAGTTLRDAVVTVFGENWEDAVSAQTREGNAADVLIEESKDAELVIVGSRGHGGFVGLLIGATSAQVAEHAHCPVMVVHEKQPAAP